MILKPTERRWNACLVQRVTDARYRRQFSDYRPGKHWRSSCSAIAFWPSDDTAAGGCGADLIQPAEIVREFIANRPSWLSIQAPSRDEKIPLLQEGEIAAINLARELKADLLLIDEVQGRRAAAARNIPLTGTIGVLEMAAKANLLDLKEAFDQVKRTDFWISPKLLDERLKVYQERKTEEGI